MIDARNETIGYKIRNAETQKVPYMLVVGKRELESDSVAVRRHGSGKQGIMSVVDFKNQIQKEIDTPFRS
jgi:threonyl-tRNA synthetase